MAFGDTPGPDLWQTPERPVPFATRPPGRFPRFSRRPLGGRTLAIAVIALAILAGALAGGIVALTISPTRTSPADSNISGINAAIQTSILRDVPAVITAVRKSVVSIEFEATGTDFRGRPVTQRGAGTGFVFATGGLIATNAHNVADASAVAVTLPDGRTVEGTVVGRSKPDDLAVIKVPEAGLEPLPLGASGSLQVGESVLVVGYALALPGSPTASLGIVSALGRSLTTSDGQAYVNLIQTDAAVNTGDSGGPLVDMRGRVVGINTVATTTAESIGFAIAIDEALPVLRRLAETGH